MASKTSKAPGYFDREIDLTAQTQSPVGVPAGVIGSSEKGPAFVPTTMGSFNDFITKFGDLNPRHPASYAVDKFLENRTALTFIRVLGAGANETDQDFEATRTMGTVKNAGMFVSSANGPTGAPEGGVQFLVARHVLSSSEAFGYPIFTNNDSFLTSGSLDEVYLVRGTIMAASGTRIQILGYNENYSLAADDLATANPVGDNTFKVVISSSNGTPFATTEGFSGVRILTTSLDPASDNYFAKVLNSDPEKFAEYRHLVYADYAVDKTVASVGLGVNDIAIVSGSANTSPASGDTTLPYRQGFGKFDTRYTTPKTTWFISQPFGDTEYNLFRFETIDDGLYANNKYKISIANLQKSSNPRYPFGTFSVVVRNFTDTDVEPEIIEQFNDLNLDPNSPNYIAAQIGNKKVFFNFDVEGEDERRLTVQGEFGNKSKYIRVVMDESVRTMNVPKEVLPFGFRGINTLKTNALVTDTVTTVPTDVRLGVGGTGFDERLLAAVVPPLPLRFKVTRGEVSTAGGLIGAPGPLEIADSRYFWGVNFGKVANALNPNVTTEPSKMISSLTRFSGIEQLDMLVTGSTTDQFCNNKFTLARVALGNAALTDITSSVATHMKEAAYIRNGRPDGTNYTINDNGNDRITLATLLQKGSTAADFNRFADYAKFTTVMYGGWDGTNITDKNAVTFSDRSTSKEARGAVRGNSHAAYVSPGFSTNQNGIGLQNNQTFAYRTAAYLITDPVGSNVNIIVVPGQREPFVADYVADRTRDYNMAIYTMDIPTYNSDSDRIFDNDAADQFVDVLKTAEMFESRAYDNFYAASYFPNVVVNDIANNRRVTVPASVAALAALGFNDKVAYPWFAPAGFNRASLDFVTRTDVRIKQSERDRLEAVKINPIVKFPGENSYVIFAQDTLQASESALSSINVQRMVGDVKRQVIDIANKLIFDNISPAIRAEFVKNCSNALSLVQSRQGIEKFKVVCDATNNTPTDENNNQMNGRIVIVPTRSIEQITVDFVIVPSGVSFL